MLCLCRSANASEISTSISLDCNYGKLVSRNFVNTAPAYPLMPMLWCSHLLLNFANAYAYALVKTSLKDMFIFEVCSLMNLGMYIINKLFHD